MLDLVSVRLFLLVVEFGNLTRAAEAAGTVQPVVSARIKALEAMLGFRLLERTPRFVRLTSDGVAFVDRARLLMAAHDEALRPDPRPAPRLAIGASDHVLGTGLEQVIRQLRLALPARSSIELRVGLSQHVRAAFDAGELDAAIVRREAGGSDGEVLGRDPLGWRAMATTTDEDGVVPLVTLGPPCGVRAAAIRHLDAARRPWREAFTGGSTVALLAAVRAGLGVAPMGAIASGGLDDAGSRLGLPPLPASEVVMLARTGSPETRAAARTLQTVLRITLRAG